MNNAHVISLPTLRAPVLAKRAIVSDAARTFHFDGALVGLVVGLVMWVAVATAVLTSLTGLSSVVTYTDNPEIVVVGR